MNQFKHIFGLPSTLSHTVRSSSLSRSTGSNGRDSAKSRDILAVKRIAADYSSELKLSGKSYARLIADYSKAIEGQNTGTKFDSGFMGSGLKIGFFSKTPFEHPPRVSSFVKAKNGGNNTGSGPGAKSSTRTLVAPNETISNANGNGGLDETEILAQVTERADWLDQVVEAHKAKRAKKNNGSSSNYKDDKNECTHPSVQKTIISMGQENSKECFAPKMVAHTSRLPQNSNVVRNECLKTYVKNRNCDAKNISVTVKPRRDTVANEFDAKNIAENTKFLVTVTEESESSSYSDYSPLNHIDLRINGRPAIDSNTTIGKAEKLDLVSLGDKIEIKIPVFANTTGNTGESRAANSTINLCISSHVKGPIDPGGNAIPAKVGMPGDSGSGNSRSGSAHPSTFYITKAENGQKTAGSKVVPWWTTEESFRRREIAPVRSSESATVFEEAKTSAITEVAARGNNQESSAGDDAKKVTISDAEMEIKTAVTKPSSLRQRLRARRKGRTAISKIIENELRKKSEERPENAQQHAHPGVTKSVAKHDIKVKTATNKQKKGTPSAIIDETVTEKSDRSITPTLNKASEKMPTTVSTEKDAKISIPKSVNELETRVESGQEANDNSSNREESNRPKLITAVVKNSYDNKSGKGSAMDTRNVSKASENLGRRQKVDEKTAMKVLPHLSRTYGNIKRLPTAQSVFESVERLNPAHSDPVKENDESINKRDGKHAKVKSTSTAIKPMEKKKDGTLIDYGLSVSTRKKPHKKLLDAQSTAGARIKKTSENEEPTIDVAIEEVIPRSDKQFRSSSINSGIVYPAKLKQSGSAKPGQNKPHTPHRKHHPCLSKKSTLGLKTVNTKNSKIFKTAKKSIKNSSNSPGSKNIEAESPEKKLLYSVWLRRSKNRDDNDPDPTKDPRDS